MKEIINILCATDDNYVPYCGIMLTSVFDSNKDTPVNAYILIDKELSFASDKKLQKLAKKYNNKIYYCMVDNSFLEKFPIKGMNYWSIATYYRLYATDLLPKSVHRILYLDCDIVVDNPIDYLWKIDMNNTAVGSVPDIFDYSGHFQNRLRYPKEAGYFNAGVLLINVDYWREHSIGKKCLDYLANNYEIIEANDQDVLNAVLWDKKITLPLRYNYQIQYLKHNFYNALVQYKDEIDSTKKSPTIIHYAAPQKPWSTLYYKMPYKQIWRKYKWISPWWYILPKLSKHKTVNYFIKRFFLWPLGIKWKNDYQV